MSEGRLVVVSRQVSAILSVPERALAAYVRQRSEMASSNRVMRDGMSSVRIRQTMS